MAARHARKFARLPAEWRQIAFYSEGAAFTKYLRPVVDALITHEGRRVAYLTSDRNDPILTESHSRIAAFYIGSGVIRTWVFQTLRASVLVVTTPDLQTHQLKRSVVYPVHYAYLHHSLVSTHRIYRPSAFDHFDSVLCAGPHQELEIRAWEASNGLPPKRLFQHGYAPLDLLLSTAGSVPSAEQGLNILLAPSWGENSLIERGIEPVVDALLHAGHQVVVRPHPMTLRHRGEAFRNLEAGFRGHPRFSLDADTTTMQALLDAHVMLSDWSGVAMEFAFGLLRPVLFVDGPPKVNNPHWAQIDIQPLEESYRLQVGDLLDPHRPHDAPCLVEGLWTNRQAYAARAERLRHECAYNLGLSGLTGGRIIAQLAEELAPAGACASR